jgi:hypothetical protein
MLSPTFQLCFQAVNLAVQVIKLTLGREDFVLYLLVRLFQLNILALDVVNARLQCRLFLEQLISVPVEEYIAPLANLNQRGFDLFNPFIDSHASWGDRSHESFFWSESAPQEPFGAPLNVLDFLTKYRDASLAKNTILRCTFTTYPAIILSSS